VARKRGTETIGDMVRSMLVVLVPVALIAGFVGLVRPSTPEVREVDWAGALETARESAEFAVLGPVDLPEGWTATRAAYETGASASDDAWRLSFVTDGGEYVGLVQRPADLDRVVRAELGDFEPDGTSLVAGETWERYIDVGDEPADHALVAQVDETAVVVLTSAGDYSLAESFASALR
jgi:hypothetical protein